MYSVRSHFQVMGRQPDGFGLMEAGYSVGLAIGILVFFNHIAVKKLNTDPTPLEVEMRLYEENICKTLIDQAGRKEKEIDVDKNIFLLFSAFVPAGFMQPAFMHFWPSSVFLCG